MRDSRTYILVHDGMDEHPKIEGLSDAAFRALHRCLYYCSRNLTDGRLTDTAWRNRAKTPRVRHELVDADLVHLPGYVCPHDLCPPAPEGHVQMHDYLDWQRSAEEVAELKRKRAEAGAKGGKARANGQASAKQVPQQTASKSVAPTEVPTELQLNSGGDLPEVDARDEPPRCSNHQGLRREDVPDCWACGHKREQWETTRTADETFQRPPWCGDCDQWTRKLEVQVDGRDAMRNCPVCHPLAQESA